MMGNVELVRFVQIERGREIEQARRARIAACARACCRVPASFVGRLVRSLRPAPNAC